MNQYSNLQGLTSSAQELLDDKYGERPKKTDPSSFGHIVSLVPVEDADELALEQFNEVPVWVTSAMYGALYGPCVVASDNPTLERCAKYFGVDFLFLESYSIEEALRQVILHYPDANYIRVLSPRTPVREPSFFDRYDNACTGKLGVPDYRTYCVRVGSYLDTGELAVYANRTIIPQGVFATDLSSVLDVTNLEARELVTKTPLYKLYGGTSVLILEREPRNYDFCEKFDIVVAMYPHVCSANILYDDNEATLKAASKCWLMFGATYDIANKFADKGVMTPFVSGPLPHTRLGLALKIVAKAFPGKKISVAGAVNATTRNEGASLDDINQEIEILKELNVNWVTP